MTVLIVYSDKNDSGDIRGTKDSNNIAGEYLN